MRRPSRVICLVPVVLLAACAPPPAGGPGGPDGGVAASDGGGPTPAPTLVGLEVGAPVAYVPTGRTAPLAARAVYSDGSKKDVTAQATWSAADPSVASVATPGQALGQAPGTTRITAAWQGQTGTLLLTVGRPVGGAGATVPWVEYEAEDGETNGTVLGPTRTQGQLAEEASGRRAVKLAATGDYVRFTTTAKANSIVVRYAIPDAAAGGGLDATLGLYVDGTRVKSLALTSRYAWLYGGPGNSTDNTPGPGAHHFYDEVHALLSPIPAGATVTLQKDAGDTAAWYVIDLVDLEEVAPPLTQPAGSVSITDFGATPDDGTDDSAAIQKAVDSATSQGKAVWIPQGTFTLASAPIYVTGGTLTGAGMWYSTLAGPDAKIVVSGSHDHFADFAVFGEQTARDDAHGLDGFDGAAGSGSTLDRVWIEHTKVGWWVVGTDGPNTTDGLTITGARVRDTMADGINLASGTSHSAVTESTFRNTGDDALGAYSAPDGSRPDTGDVFRHDTVQLPWRAHCFAIYGGTDNTVEDDDCVDTAQDSGLELSSYFGSYAFAGTTTLQRVTVLRGGGTSGGSARGAVTLDVVERPVADVVLKDLLVDGATFSGLEVSGPDALTGLTLDNLQVTAPGTSGVTLAPNAKGTGKATAVVVTAPGTQGLDDRSNGGFSVTRGPFDAGW